MRFEELEDQRGGHEQSEGDQPDSDKGRFQDFLSPPLMLWPGVVHYRFLTAGCHRERAHTKPCPSDLLRRAEAPLLELQPKPSEVGEDQPHAPLSN